MKKGSEKSKPFRVGATRRRIVLVFVLQFLAVTMICVMGIFNVAPVEAVIAVILITSVLACMAMHQEWRPIRALAEKMQSWNDDKPDSDVFSSSPLSARTDADIASLTQGLQGFAHRVSGYSERERNFTRDASHELRSPLTVIKMSVDMLADEADLSAFGARSVQRIQRSTRELEAVVESLLVLARESDLGGQGECFVVNDVLSTEIESARDLLAGRPIDLQLEQPARFAVEGSRRVFSVLCWQLIRNACQQTERGRIVITVFPGVIAVSSQATVPDLDRTPSPLPVHGTDRHGFELAIARRISDRFAWPLELQSRPGGENVASIRFPDALPV